MSEMIPVGRDLAKNVSQVHGADASGRTVLRKTLRRDQVLTFFGQLPRCVLALRWRALPGPRDRQAGP